jgi:hypothetical protein
LALVHTDSAPVSLIKLFGNRGGRMWSEVIQVLIALPIAAALLLLVPRRVSRAWAIWLLIGLMAGSLQWIGQGIYTYYNPDWLYLFTKENQLEFQKDQAGEVARVVVHNPPERWRASRGQQQFHRPASTWSALARRPEEVERIGVK